MYYRLNVVSIRLAPLRDRREDLPVLIDHFCGCTGRSTCSVTNCGGEMMNYDWPGNVRELENCIQHMVAVNSGPVLHPADVPSSLVNARLQAGAGQRGLLAARGSATMAGDGSGYGESASSRDPEFFAGTVPRTIVPLCELERAAILNALEYTKGDRMMAAHLLGIGRTTCCSRKLKEYNRVSGLIAALDATYSVGPAPSGVGVYSREILNGVAVLRPRDRFLHCYRAHRLWRGMRADRPINARPSILLESVGAIPLRPVPRSEPTPAANSLPPDGVHVP